MAYDCVDRTKRKRSGWTRVLGVHMLGLISTVVACNSRYMYPNTIPGNGDADWWQLLRHCMLC